jgi:tRNA threonylcarbamoyladenosine biosynthesis protein TsaB
VTLILCIETSATRCSVALFDGERIVGHIFTEEERAHSAQLAVFVDRLIKEAGHSPGDLSAIAYSQGPGSYTGLRVGLSLAKGMCFALDVPLIAIPTLYIIYVGAKQNVAADHYVCLQDARRMEAYVAIYKDEGHLITPEKPRILDENWMREIAGLPGTVLVAGTGVKKAQPLFEHHTNVQLKEVSPDAIHMGQAALSRYEKGSFENILLSEPLYIKAPNVTVPRPKYP